MFLSNKKLDSNLRYYLTKNAYKSYRVLIKYKNFQSSIGKKISSYKGSVNHIIESIGIISANLSSKGVERLAEYPEVEKIYLDEYLFLCGSSVSSANKFYFSNNKNLSGAGVGIGLVDSGIFPHPDLLSPSHRIETFTDLINDLKYPYDDNGHGTAIAGILCSSGLSSNNMYKGICPKSKLFCYKAFDKLGKGYASDILYSIECLINLSKVNNIKILCLPFELLSHNIFIVTCFDEIFKHAISNNMIPIVPSGSNLGVKSSIQGIATLSSCITVGGLNTSSTLKKPYDYSAFGVYCKTSKPDLCAACVDITTLNSNTNYISERDNVKLYPNKLEITHKNFSGTSLAAAYVCGICALILEKNMELNFNDIKSLLKISCNKIEDISNVIQGEGTLDLAKLNL